MKQYIHRNSSDPYNFYVGESPFHPHGISRWIFDKQEHTENKLTAEEFLHKMKNSGINTLRMVVPGEYEHGVEPELGKYNPNFLKPLDHVFELAADLGIYIVLCLFDYASFYTPWDPKAWSYGIYSTKFSDVKDFFGSKELRKYEKGRLEFLVSHFNKFPNVFAWEVMNEMNYLGKPYGKQCKEVTMEWFDDVARFIRKIEPNRLITGSLYGGEIWESLFSHQLNDFVQIHTYDEVYDSDKNAECIRDYITQNKKYNKPVAVTEFGSRKDNPQRANFVCKALLAAQREGSSAWLYVDIWEKVNDGTMGDMNDELFQVFKECAP